MPARLHASIRPIAMDRYPMNQVQALWDRIQSQVFPVDTWNASDGAAWFTQMLSPANIFYEIGEMNGLAGFVDMGHGHYRVQFAIWEDIAELDVPEKILKTIIPFLFQEQPLVSRVTAFISAKDSAALQVAAGMGLKLEAVLSRAVLSGGMYHDLKIFRLLRTEVLANNFGGAVPDGSPRF